MHDSFLFISLSYMTELSIFPNSILGSHKIEWCKGHILLGTQIFFLSLSMIMTTIGNKRSGKDSRNLSKRKRRKDVVSRRRRKNGEKKKKKGRKLKKKRQRRKRLQERFMILLHKLNVIASYLKSVKSTA